MIKIQQMHIVHPEHGSEDTQNEPVNDTVDSVGKDLGGQPHKYWGTVADENRIIYGIPCNSTRIIKFDTTTKQPDADADALIIMLMETYKLYYFL